MADDTARGQGTDRGNKSDTAFRTISEVAAELDLPQHVLRFWETRFSQVKPLKRGGGRRYYRPEDMQLLRRIRDLLYLDGYTIKGVQKLLRQSGSVKGFVESEASDEGSVDDEVPAVMPPGQRSDARSGSPVAAPEGTNMRPLIEQTLSELRGLRDMLRQSAGN